MKSYADLLEAALSESVEGTGGDVIAIVAKALGCEREEAEDRMGELSIDTATEIADAASQGDIAEIVLRMGKHPGGSLQEDITQELPKSDSIPPNADYEDENGQLISGQTGQPVFQQEVEIDPATGEPLAPNGQPMDLRQQHIAKQQAAQNPQPAVQPTKPNPDARQEQTPANRPATKASGTVTQSRGTQGTGPRPMAEHFGAGDEVKVGDKEGVISGVDDGPAASNTIGVLIDGTLEMVKKDKVTMADKKLDEHVLGMTNVGTVPGMRAMMELAMFNAKTDEDAIDAEIEEAEKEPAEDEAEKAEAPAAEEAKPEADKAPAEEAPAAAELLVFDISAGTESNVAAPSAAEPAGDAAVEGECDPRSEIYKALDVIERNMPDLRMGDFRDIRARLDKVSNMVLERAMNRRPKL